jgi:ABC-2 type transport system permease protein
MKILDIALKDLLRSFRSFMAIGMMVVAPLLLTGLMYFAFGSTTSGSAEPPAVTVGVVNQDVLPDGSSLDEPLGNAIQNMFHDDSVKSWLTANDYPDETAARAAVDRQEIGVAVIIPPGFTNDFLSQKKDTPIRLVQDPTLSIGPVVVQNMVTSLLDGVNGAGIVIETIRQRQAAMGLAFDPAQVSAWIEKYQNWYTGFQRSLFHDPEKAALVLVAPADPAAGAAHATENPMQRVLSLVMVGQIIFFAFFTGAFSMMSILREDEEGTLARLFTTPTERTLILTGKFFAVVLTVILQGFVLILAAHFIFGVNWGNPLNVSLALAGQVFAATGLGVLLISFVKTSKQAGAVLGGGLTALGMLGGLFTVAVPDMPAAFTALARFTPQGWVLRGWRMVLDGQPTADLILPLAVLLAMGVVMFAAGAFMFRRRFA